MSVELEERLEMVNLTVLAGEAAASSALCDFSTAPASPGELTLAPVEMVQFSSPLQ
ncbi:hypothetical protein [Myroides odoratus]|uniref:hypothetical protein n=1 Tax=Myroides odoratus TaxID=256 RepID=UPI0039AF95C7